jgi:hypothetical protein
MGTRYAGSSPVLTTKKIYMKEILIIKFVCCIIGIIGICAAIYAIYCINKIK